MKTRAILLLCVAILFAMTPLIFTDFMGYDPTDFPVQIQRPSVQPAGYAFSIWGLIYLALLIHAGWGLFKRDTDPAWDRPRVGLMVAMGLGSLWIVLAGSQPVWATVVILVMAVAAIGALLSSGRTEHLLQMTPVAIFAGWVTAASGVASGVTMAGLGWLPDTSAAVVCILAVLVLASSVQLRIGRVPEYGATVIWALIGIVVANRGLNTTVEYLAIAGVVVMLGVIYMATRRA